MWLKTQSGRYVWRRKIKWHDSTWLTSSGLREKRFAALISAEETKGRFDEKFFEGLEKRRDLAEGRELKIQALQLPIILFLMLIVIGVDVKFSVLGLTPVRADGFREILLCISSTLGFLTTTFQFQKDLANEMLRVHCKSRSNGHPDAEPFFKLRYGLQTMPWDPNPAEKFLVGSKRYMYIFYGILALLFFGLLALFIVTVLALQLWVIIDILKAPTFSGPTTWLVIGYVGGIDALVILFHVWKIGPFLYSNYQNFDIYIKMKEIDPERQQKILKEMLQTHERRGEMMRVVGRPKLPKIDP